MRLCDGEKIYLKMEQKKQKRNEIYLTAFDIGSPSDWQERVRTSGLSGARYESAILKCHQLDGEIEKLKQQRIKFNDFVRAVINQMDDRRFSFLLECRYISLLHTDDIALMVGCSRRTVQRRLKEAVKEFAETERKMKGK